VLARQQMTYWERETTRMAATITVRRCYMLTVAMPATLSPCQTWVRSSRRSPPAPPHLPPTTAVRQSQQFIYLHDFLNIFLTYHPNMYSPQYLGNGGSGGGANSNGNACKRTSASAMFLANSATSGAVNFTVKEVSANISNNFTGSEEHFSAAVTSTKVSSIFICFGYLPLYSHLHSGT